MLADLARIGRRDSRYLIKRELPLITFDCYLLNQARTLILLCYQARALPLGLTRARAGL